MIDSKLFSIIELNESFPLLDIYSNKLLTILFRFFYIINLYELQNFFVELCFKIVYFLHFFFIGIIGIPINDIKSDILLELIYQLKYYLFVHNIINTRTKYIIGLIFCYLYSLLLIFIIIKILIKKEKTTVRLIIIYNYLNHIYINYFFCFQLNIMLFPSYCKDSKVSRLEIDCLNPNHIIILIFNSFILIFSIIYLIIISKFIGTINDMEGLNIYSSTPSNYDIYSNIFCILCYLFGYFIEIFFSKNDSYIVRTLIRIFFMICCFIISIYLIRKVFFYNKNMNMLYLCGWVFSMWFYFSIIIKKILKIKQIFLFNLYGWVTLGIIIFLFQKFQSEKSLFSINIFDATSVKDVEIFINTLYNIIKNENEKNKILLMGINNVFKEYISDKPQLKDYYEKFIYNQYLKNKYCKKGIIIHEYLCLIYVLLYSIMDKFKNDAILLFCSFLKNKLRNLNFSMYLCSKYKQKGYYENYVKYSLIEDIKILIKNRLEDELNLDNINRIEIGSVILYNQESEKLKLKIYEAASCQIDYFDAIKNNNILNSNVSFFLNNGISILKYRKEILEIWNKIISLNPFSQEIKKDYMLYLKYIIQDEELANNEETRYNRYKNLKLIEKDKIYYSLFDKDISSVLLIDGFVNKEKIIYVTQNFYTLFNYNPKGLNTLQVSDLIPKYISTFHKELIDDALKYSNIKTVFKKEKDLLLKGKNNELYDIKGFFKLVPDLTRGLINIGLIKKIKDKEFLIVLDKDFNIDSMTTPFYCSDLGNIIIKNNYPFGLNNEIIGNHISTIIPSIIPLFHYKNSHFIIKKLNIDFKGILFPKFNDIEHFNARISNILDKIKQGTNINYESKINSSSKTYSKSLFLKDKNDNNKGEYFDLLDEYNKKFKNDSYYISYKITKHSFLNGKYRYYRIYINRDVFSELEIQERRNTITKNQPSSILFKTFNNEFKMEDINNEKRKIKLVDDDKKLSSKNKRISQLDKTKLLEINKNLEDLNQIENNKNILEKQSTLNNYSLSNNSKKSNNNLHFREMKLKLSNNETPKSIIMLRSLSFIFSLSTMILIIYNNSSMKSKFKTIQNYLNQNFFFNRTKVSLLILNYVIINLKLIKYKTMGSNGCIGEYLCISNNTEVMLRAMNNLKSFTSESINFNNDYLEIFHHNLNLELYANFLNNNTIYNANIIDLLYFILSYSKKLLSNIEKYIYNDDKYYEMYVECILKYIKIYLETNESNGLNDNEKRKNTYKSQFKTNKIYLIFNTILFSIVFCEFIYMSYKFYKVENEIIIKIVRFHCPSFENYIKYLGDLRKKLKNDSNEEEKSINNDESSNEYENNEEKKNLEQKKKEEDEKLKEKNKKLIKKKKISKIAKINYQKNEKIKAMSHYFLIYNIFYSLQICTLCLLIMSYYILVILLYEYRKNNFIVFDDYCNSIASIFSNTYIAYQTLKNQTIYFTSFMIEKNKTLNELDSGNEYSLFFNEVYSKENYTLLKNQNYIFEIPDEKDTTIEKLGTLITLFTSNVDLSVNNSKVVMVNLYNGNACEILYKVYFIDDDKYNKCLKFWSSIVTQGIEQCLSQLELEMINIISYFNYLNNSTEVYNNLHILENSFSNCEEFIIIYLFYAYKVTQLVLEDLKNDKRMLILFTFDIIVYIYIIGCIFLFICLLIIIYYGKQKFGYLINFILIFPFQYLLEERILYQEIIELYKMMYR